MDKSMHIIRGMMMMIMMMMVVVVVMKVRAHEPCNQKRPALYLLTKSY